MFLHLSFNCVLLLLLLLLTGSSEAAYPVKVGKNAYLCCSYAPSTPGTLVPMCWGKGPCLRSHCVSLVLSTDERAVTYWKSSKYQLKGTSTEDTSP